MYLKYHKAGLTLTTPVTSIRHEKSILGIHRKNDL
jgi:hypothetical protein